MATAEEVIAAIAQCAHVPAAHVEAWDRYFSACLARVTPREAAEQADAALVLSFPELRWVLCLEAFVRRCARVRHCAHCGAVAVPAYTQREHTRGGPVEAPLCSSECVRARERALRGLEADRALRPWDPR